MFDKNGKEIKTGDIVQISKSFFKNDNGFYFCESSPGDPNWIGNYHCLKKISKRGKISTAKYNLCSWPIMVFTNSRDKRAEAQAWNKKHATIEVVQGGIDRSEVARYFSEEVSKIKPVIDRGKRDYGEDSEYVKKLKSIQSHYEAVSRILSDN